MSKYILIKDADFSAVKVKSVAFIIEEPLMALVNNKVKINGFGNTVFYTTDGTTPTDNSLQYSEPFSVQLGTTIKAIAKSSNGEYSDVVTKTLSKSYYYGFSSEEFDAASNNWSPSSIWGFGISNQSNLQGKNIKGIRIKVHNTGTLKLFKASLANPDEIEQLTEIGQVTALNTGVQDLDLSTEYNLNENEYVILGSPYEGSSFIAKYGGTGQPFYYKCGQANPVFMDNGSLCVDFYGYELL